jgi:pimeloyl-ACP methyl ester carboxylesterase
VIAIDAPGHGESGPGRYGRGRATMLDFIDALRTAVDQYGRPHAVIGHSFGAAAVAVAALDGLAADRLVLIAPVANVMSGLDYFARLSGVGPRIRSRMPRQIERITGRPVTDFDIPARSAEYEELPEALVVHDTRDKEVPFDNGALIAAAWPGGRLLATEGLGHKRILRDAGLVETVMGFLGGKQELVSQ